MMDFYEVDHIHKKIFILEFNEINFFFIEGDIPGTWEVVDVCSVNGSISGTCLHTISTRKKGIEKHRCGLVSSPTLFL